MAKQNTKVVEPTGSEIFEDGFDPTVCAWREIHFAGDSAEVRAVQMLYPELKIQSIRVTVRPARWMVRKENASEDFLIINVNAAGAFENLARYRLVHHTWRGGRNGRQRSYRTEGFGLGWVYPLQDGTFEVRGAILEHGLDLIAPALVPLHLGQKTIS